jgi:NADPH:quinone reductase-like Zn-dependent oxidoreductase
LRVAVPLIGGGRSIKAIIQHRYGSALEDVLRLQEMDRPTIGDEEVLVRVRAASVTGAPGT